MFTAKSHILANSILPERLIRITVFIKIQHKEVMMRVIHHITECFGIFIRINRIGYKHTFFHKFSSLAKASKPEPDFEWRIFRSDFVKILANTPVLAVFLPCIPKNPLIQNSPTYKGAVLMRIFMIAEQIRPAPICDNELKRRLKPPF
jgi:hypothetical protein